MKHFQKSKRALTPIRGVAMAVIVLTTGFAMPAVAADYIGGRLGIERQEVERPQAERRPDKQVERREEKQADRRHDRREDRIERYEERRYADRHERHRVYRQPIWRGDIRYFDRDDGYRWRGGAWRHARHEGRLGWWWVVSGSWYFYPEPVYPYPDPYTPYFYSEPVYSRPEPYIPPVVIVQPEQEESTPDIVVTPAAASQYWYYCESRDRYYPYIASCPEGWKAVLATPPNQ